MTWVSFFLFLVRVFLLETRAKKSYHKIIKKAGVFVSNCSPALFIDGFQCLLFSRRFGACAKKSALFGCRKHSDLA